MSVLKGKRVIEFAQGVPGPLAAVRMGDLGAEVIKVEAAEGDWLRNAAPQIPGTSMSAAFFELNRGKRAITLGNDPAQASGLLASLLKTADVFITDRTPAELVALGLGDVNAAPYTANPGLITVSISPWGEEGPWKDRKGSELAAQAMAGYTRYLGTRDAPACRLGADVACAGTGIFAGQAILAALFARARNGGTGQRITLSLLNSLLALKSIHLAAQTDPDRYAGPRVGGANYPPERGWKTKDEPIFFAFGGSVGAQGRPGWVKFVEEAGFTSLLEDKRFDPIGRTTTGYGSLVQEVRGIYEREFSRYTANELVDMIRKYSGNAASYQRADEAIRHEQTTALKVVRRVPAGDGREIEIRAFPARFSNLQTEQRGNAPAPGQHTLEVARAAGLSSAQIDALLANGGLASTNSGVAAA
jgi:crotonobetainyl-CoA:carnitine CoA-transferase CaiB-like acyl-CoA transferase